MIPIACVHGRFQILHLQHLEYVLAAMARTDHLIVGITNYDAMASSTDDSDAHRRAKANNPLTYFERTLMVRRVMLEAGISADRFSCSPFPIEHPEDLPNFISRDIRCFTTVREAWNVTKIDRLRAQGYEVEILLDSVKRISSTELRQMIVTGNPAWRAWVTPEVAYYLLSLGIEGRLSALGSGA